MNLQELLTKYLEEDKVKELLKEMKDNKIFTSSEENLDIRYKDLQDKSNAKDLELQEAKKLVETLQNSNLDVETIKKELEDYKAKSEKLEEDYAELQRDSALRFALQDAKVTNVDYIAFKINQDLKANDKKLELDENGHIKGINEMIDTQRKAEPTFFTTEAKKEVEVKDLGKANEGSGQAEPENLLDALTQHYNPKNEI